VRNWRQIPPKHCAAIESAFGVSRHELRPDIFGDLQPTHGEEAALARAAIEERRPEVRRRRLAREAAAKGGAA